MCALTVSSIGLLIYCLADVDQTHTGFMRIPVERLDQLDFVGRTALTGDGEHAKANSGFWTAKSLTKNLNSKSAFRFDSTLMKKRISSGSQWSSLPILPGYAKGANMEEQGSSSLLPGTPTTHSRSKNMRKLSSGHEVENSAWQSGIESSGFRELSTGGLDEHIPRVSSPISSTGELNLRVPQMKSLMRRKSNAILLAKDVFASHNKGEIDVAAINL